jgi:hypothetical protein
LRVLRAVVADLLLLLSRCFRYTCGSLGTLCADYSLSVVMLLRRPEDIILNFQRAMWRHTRLWLMPSRNILAKHLV